MGLKIGMTNNPNGRPKGSLNKVTEDLRLRISEFLDDNWQTVQDDFELLKPKERIMFYERLLQYGLPRLQSTQLTVEKESLIDMEANDRLLKAMAVSLQRHNDKESIKQ